MDDHAPPRRAARSPRAWVVLIASTALLLAADLVSKYLAFAHIHDTPVSLDRDAVLQYVEHAPGRLHELVPAHDPIVVAPHLLELKLVLNPGAVFGAAGGQRTLFILFTLLAVAFCTYIFARWTNAREHAAHVAVALVLAGGIGNLYDRVVYGCVRDFLHPLPGVPLPFGITWPNSGSAELWPWVSNVADAYLIVGIAVIVVKLWRHDPGRATAPPPPDRA